MYLNETFNRLPCYGRAPGWSAGQAACAVRSRTVDRRPLSSDVRAEEVAMTKAAQRARERCRRLRRMEHLVPILRDHPSERETEPFLDARLADVEGWE